MDIISYSKAKKAKYAVREVNQHIGHTNEYKHGLEDVNDSYNTADERISNMENKASPATLNRKISEESARVMVNLNKHNLKVNSLLNATRYNLKNHLFDTFADDSTILYSESSNIQYNTSLKRIELIPGKASGTVVFKPISIGKQIEAFALSFEGSGLSLKNVPIPLDEQNTYTNFDKDTKKIEVQKQVQSSNGTLVNVYKEQAVIETPVISLGKEINGISSIPLNPNVDCYIKDSKNNITFSEYRKIDSFPISCEPYVQLKFVLHAMEQSIQIKTNTDFTDVSSGHFFGSLTSKLAPVLKRKFDIDVDSKTTTNSNGIIVNANTMKMNAAPYLRRKFNIHNEPTLEDNNAMNIKTDVYPLFIESTYNLI